MYKLITLLKRIAVPLLFILAEALAIYHYARSTSYNNARILSATNSVTGTISGGFRSVGDYFSLAEENRELRAEVELLRNRLADLSIDSLGVESYSSSGEIAPYIFSSARVLQKSVMRSRNFFVINKGQRDGVQANMAVLSMRGEAAGYVVSCSEKFAICMSLANLDFTMGGQIKNKEFTGSIRWNGNDHRKVMLYEIPRYASPQVGDTIVSTVSFRFPPEVTIGYIESWEEAADQTTFDIKLRTAVDLATLRDVLLVQYVDSQEYENLINSVE